jgi:hypothetical protein
MNSMKIKFRLLSSTCLLLACKVEEIYHPTVEDLVAWSGSCFTKEQLVTMEQNLLINVFNFDISTPTRYEFSSQFATLAKLTDHERSMVTYLVELSLFDFNLNYFRPSLVAAGAIHLTLQMLKSRNSRIWSPALEKITRCNEYELREVVMRLRILHSDSAEPRIRFSVDKYGTDEYQRVSERMAIGFTSLRFDNYRFQAKEEAAFVGKNYCLD